MSSAESFRSVNFYTESLPPDDFTDMARLTGGGVGGTLAPVEVLAGAAAGGGRRGGKRTRKPRRRNVSPEMLVRVKRTRRLKVSTEQSPSSFLFCSVL